MGRTINSLVIHCADSPDTYDYGAEHIEEWHKERALKGEPWTPFKDLADENRYIGYHYVVKRNGVVQSARPEIEIGCHAKGHNKFSLGVCWIGSHIMPVDQKVGLMQLVCDLCIRFGIEPDHVFGHCESSAKTCPNFNSIKTFESMDHFRKKVEESIRIILKTGGYPVWTFSDFN